MRRRGVEIAGSQAVARLVSRHTASGPISSERVYSSGRQSTVKKHGPFIPSGFPRSRGLKFAYWWCTRCEVVRLQTAWGSSRDENHAPDLSLRSSIYRFRRLSSSTGAGCRGSACSTATEVGQYELRDEVECLLS
jgi:hypothetical protein